MIKIELINQHTEEKETFIKDFVSGRDMRNVISFAAKAEKEKLSELEQLDELIYLVVSLFKNDAVSYDTILDGTSSENLAPTLQNVIEQVMGGEGKAKGNVKKK